MARWPPLLDERGVARWGFKSRVIVLKFLLFSLLVPFLLLTKFFFPDDFANRRATEPNLNLVNKESLDKILQAEVFVHNDGQLRTAHLILGYKSISFGFQAPKCVIKAKDPLLHYLSVVALGFLLPGPTPKWVLATTPIPNGIPKAELPLQWAAEKEATPSQPVIQEEEEVVDLSEFEDDFEVFNCLPSPKVPTEGSSYSPFIKVSQTQEDMGIQRKPRASLMEVIES